MNRTITKLLEQRCKLAIGSLAFVEKQLQSVLQALDNQFENFYDEPIRGEKEKSDTDFFITPPLEAYDDADSRKT